MLVGIGNQGIGMGDCCSITSILGCRRSQVESESLMEIAEMYGAWQNFCQICSYLPSH